MQVNEHVQSLHQLLGELVMFAGRFRLVMHALLHQQPMLDVHVQRVLGGHGVLAVRRQHFGHDVREQIDVAPRVRLDRLDQRLVELEQIVQIDGE